MTHKQRRALAAYTREMADRFGLVDWDLVLKAEQPEGADDAQGWCNPIYGQTRAELWFAPDLTDLHAGRAEYVVRHKLLHIVVDRVDTHVHALRPTVGGAAWDVFNEGWRSAVEFTVDHLARATDSPPIDWASKPAKDWIPTEKGVNWVLTSRHKLVMKDGCW